MKASVAFIFFMLFLAGIAFVNLRGMQEQSMAHDVTDARLVESPWRPVKLNGMPVSVEATMTAQFADDKQVTGTGGCNRYFGNYELAGKSLKIGPLGATRMACPEPAASLEIAFLEALQSVVTVEVKNELLILRDNAGNAVLQMQAADSTE